MNSQNEEKVRHYRPIGALAPWPLSSFTTSDGAQLFYHRIYHRTGGENKPPVILLHGFQSAGLMWLRTAKALEADYDVILPNFRGHGYSSGSIQGFSLERLTEDMAELNGKLNLQKAFVVGHSMGAEIAGRLAADHPDLVRAVILVDPPMRVFAPPPSLYETDWYKGWIASMQAIKTQPPEEQRVTALKLLPPNVPLWGEEDFVPFVEAVVQFNLELLKTQSATFMNYHVATPEIADRITAPLLLMTGNPQRGSGAIPEGIAVLVPAESNRESRVFEESGHFIPIDQFEAFVAALKGFLERH